MQIINDVKLDFQDVLIRPKRSKTASRALVNLNRKYEFKTSGRTWEGVGVMAANMDSVGTFAMAKVLSSRNMITCLHKHYSAEELIDFYNDAPFQVLKNTFYSLGIREEDHAKLATVINKVGSEKIFNFNMDVANAHTQSFQDKVKRFRDKNIDAIIMAGNVAIPEMTQELFISGAADIAKIGIGPGSVCETRIVAGVGVPQLSAVIECADVAHGCGGFICSDGGCCCPGDVSKAFAAGADFVMLGGMLSGHDECEGEWTYGAEVEWRDNPPKGEGFGGITGKRVKKALRFYGMASAAAMVKYGGETDYRASEGKCVEVPYKGPVEDTLRQIEGGIRSACAYVGASKLKDLTKCTTFVRVNRTHNNIFGS